MARLKLKAPAKINLALDILGRREDGLHYMRMVMQTVGLCDIVTVSLDDAGITAVTCTDADIPLGEDNTAYRAAEAFFAATELANPGVNIHIEKNIPQMAGLGGGSSDAAAVLVGLNELFKTGLDKPGLCAIGLPVGADVPFCITGGTAIAEGIGDIFTELVDMPDCYMVIAKPHEDIRTSAAFAMFDRSEGMLRRPDIDMLVAAIISRDIAGVAARMVNVFEDVVGLQSVREIESVMMNNGSLGAAMTGSGSAVFGVFEQKLRAKKALAELKDSPVCRSVFLVQPVRYGASPIG